MRCSISEATFTSSAANPTALLADRHPGSLFQPGYLCDYSRGTGYLHRHLRAVRKVFHQKRQTLSSHSKPGNRLSCRDGLASVSIICPSSITGDALSTSVFLLGLERGLALLEELENVEAMLITNDRKVYLTSGLKESGKVAGQGV